MHNTTLLFLHRTRTYTENAKNYFEFSFKFERKNRRVKFREPEGLRAQRVNNVVYRYGNIQNLKQDTYPESEMHS